MPTQGFGTASGLQRSDFMTDRIIIMTYPQGAGGKFLANCLALDPGVLLQDIDLAVAQIQGRLDTVQKLELLCRSYDSIQDHWNDANLGCDRLFGFSQYPDGHAEIYKPALSHWMPYDPRLRQVIESGQLFFFMAHHAEDLSWDLKIWPRARVIWFRNNRGFMQHYRSNFPKPIFSRLGDLRAWWTQHREPSWPQSPPASQQGLDQEPFLACYQDLDTLKRSQLLDLLPNEEFFKEFDQVDADEIAATSQQQVWHRAWDADWYLDLDQFLHQLDCLRQALDLGQCDRDSVRRLYHSWISALQRYAAHHNR